MKERFAYIDFLRAFSILGVIAIHTLSFSLTNKTNFFLWNSLQFIVAAFVFCSGFVHGHYASKFNSSANTFSWFKKRAIRILMPFYIYFCVHFFLFILFPTFFTHFGFQKNTPYIFGSIFLYGGINAGWLPLLFLELTLLTPFFFFLRKKHLLLLYLAGSLAITFVGTLWFFPYSLYRETMWISWSLIFLLGLFSQKLRHSTRIFLGLAIGCGLLFLILFSLWPSLHHSLNFTDNKYPPNLYYLSFAVAGTSLFFIISKNVVKYIPQWMYEYVSKKSYSLFFIHYIVLDFLLNMRCVANVVLLFLLTVGISICISVGLGKASILVKSQK